MSLGMRPVLPVEEFRVKDPLPQERRDTWLKKTCRELTSRISLKFRLGRVQYNCDFGEQTVEYLLEQIEQEAIDQLMYVRELRRRMVTKRDNQINLPSK